MNSGQQSLARSMMLRIDQIAIDGAHSEHANGLEVPASDIFNWPVHEAGARLSPWISPTQRRVWNPERYERAVHHVINCIFSSRSGGALRRALMAGSSKIMPFGQREPTGDAAEFRYSVAGGARVLFTPAEFSQSEREPALFHELVHLARSLAGVYRKRPAHSYARYTNTEEFTAVVIENVFRSETGRTLRWGHADNTTVLTNPRTWITHPRNRMMVERIRSQMPSFAASLAQVETPFNPFRSIR